MRDASLLFRRDGYGFPREPLEVRVRVDDCEHEPFEFVAISVHLKAKGGEDNEARRESANASLEDHLRDLSRRGDTDVVVLGDFNQTLRSRRGRQVMSPWLDTARYVVSSRALSDSGQRTHQGGADLDHIVLTDDLAVLAGGVDATVAAVDREYPGFFRRVSDHLPVVLSLPVF